VAEILGRRSFRRKFGSGTSDLKLLAYDLKQCNVVFEANSIEVIKRKVAFHRLPKVLDSRIKAFQFRCFHIEILPIPFLISIRFIGVFVR